MRRAESAAIMETAVIRGRENSMIGIIGAMSMEVEGLMAALTDRTEETLCGLRFVSGKLSGVDAVVVKCGAGKVNAAMCAATMLLRYAPKLIISTGVAGGIGKGVKIGNLVVAEHSVQYDYDTTAVGEPKAGVMVCDELTVELPTSAAHNAVLVRYAQDIYNGVHTGVIATGDRFVADSAFCEQLREAFGAIACEMETGAIAHVCAANKTPFCGLRAISDNANEDGDVDFYAFARDSADKCIALLKASLPSLDHV